MKAFRSDNGFTEGHTLVLRGRIVELRRPLVMGIINLTPDSFYAGSRAPGAEDAARTAREMLEQGADIIDLGACSTRPGSQPVSEEEEMKRLEAPLEAIRKALPDAVLSVDTFRARVAEECIRRWGVDVINDVSGGDDEMYDVAAKSGAWYVLMHTRGTPAEMDGLCDYGDVVADVVSELAFKADKARARGVANLIVDPGFGFAKTAQQNFELLRRLESLKALECPILVGISRKRMAREAGGSDATGALSATIALNTAALLNGANIIRVHDVAEGVQTARTVAKILQQ